jgi:exodeoxyribonuclease V beta subunit
MKNPADGIFALPAGARTGDCLHKILEQFDFANADKATAALVKQQLTHLAWPTARTRRSVSRNAGAVAAHPLDFENPNFTLARISRAQRLSEMEFHFPPARWMRNGC